MSILVKKTDRVESTQSEMMKPLWDDGSDPYESSDSSDSLSPSPRNILGSRLEKGKLDGYRQLPADLLTIKNNYVATMASHSSSSSGVSDTSFCSLEQLSPVVPPLVTSSTLIPYANKRRLPPIPIVSDGLCFIELYDAKKKLLDSSYVFNKDVQCQNMDYRVPNNYISSQPIDGCNSRGNSDDDDELDFLDSKITIFGEENKGNLLSHSYVRDEEKSPQAKSKDFNKNLSQNNEYAKQSLDDTIVVPAKKARLSNDQDDVKEEANEEVHDSDTKKRSASVILEDTTSSQRTESEEEIVGHINFSYRSNIFNSLDYRSDIFDAMVQRERGQLGKVFLLAQRRLQNAEEHRKSVVLRIINPSARTRLTSETLHLGVYILDKCFDSFHVATEGLFDVAAVSMMLASKMEEYNPLRMNDLYRIWPSSMVLQHLSSVAILGNVEKNILEKLNYSLIYPTPFTYSNYFHTIRKSNKLQILLTNYLLELSLLSSYFRDMAGPVIAFGAICLAVILSEQSEKGFDASQVLDATEKNLLESAHGSVTIESSRKIMEWLMVEMDIASNRMHSIWREYCVEERYCVALYEVQDWMRQLISNK